jgi:glycosyl transferase family 25
MSVPIFVINLDRDTQRMEWMRAQLVAMGLPFERISGVLGSAMNDAELARDYDDGKAKWRRARSLTPAEIGCAMSHIKAYREIVARGIEAALVMEDDVVLPAELGVLLASCAAHVDAKRPEVWLLTAASVNESVRSVFESTTGHSLRRFRSGFAAGAYVVTLTGAQALLAELYPVGDVADCWERLVRFRVVDIFAFAPNPVWIDMERFGSSTVADFRRIYGENRLSRTLSFRLRRARAVVSEPLMAFWRRRFRPYAGVKGL